MTSPVDRAVSADDSSTNKTSFRRVLAGSMAGAVLEWYDFAIYGILAATVLGPLFFPGDSGIVKLLLALATQGLGFIARPLGGIVFGHLGDKLGRKPMLVITFLLLGVSTAMIGLLPTYEQIGIWATLMLVVLRMVQGFALGGEFGAAVLMVSEYGEPKRRGFWAAWPQAGAPLGTVLATAVVSAIAFVFPGDAFDEWAWRIAFLVAIPLLVVGFWIRRSVEESPVFKAAQANAEERSATTERSSVLQALSRPRAVLHGLGMRLGENIAFYIYTVFVIAYAATYFDYDRGDVIMAVTFGSLAQFIGMIGGGHWSDRVGRKIAMLVPSAVLVVWAPAFFWLVQSESLPMLWIGVCVGAFFHGMLAGSEAAWITELFPTRYRYAGASLVFQGSSIIAGAPAPLIAVWLIDSFGVATVVGYLVITMAVTVIAVATSKETKGVDLDAVA
ncbi:arabinose ABC transporter permease [Prauserella marina]|uniref:Putative proline/betaine transporter n=1 Tax=Prauserella marina TaxID=530584 RepID=A0A222VQ93_9PSEU|nr:MFS transporter [Prauserella marina]ASR36106.1 arabinose ABC transporter permease [Prauserella marina]PWV76838.1 putative MFS family arabinose efflux permease [Prauserella marina]SDC98732.1 Predicted arabinose efflux permease, MFS family [Prauserella marina]